MHTYRRKKRRRIIPRQDLCPNGAHYCNYKAQISDQALRWLAKNVQKTKSSVIIVCLVPLPSATSVTCHAAVLSVVRCFLGSP